jgi:hypothetical protein
MTVETAGFSEMLVCYQTICATAQKTAPLYSLPRETKISRDDKHLEVYTELLANQVVTL